MKKNDKLIDSVRRQSSGLENHIIDEFAAGYIDRRAFLRHGATIGMSLPVLTTLAGAFGASMVAAPRIAGAAGATIRVATTVPAAAIDPITVADGGGLLMLQQVGDFLTISGADLRLRPGLATSWKPNNDGSVWTFMLRKGVKFHNGKELDAGDVKYSVEKMLNPPLPGTVATVS